MSNDIQGLKNKRVGITASTFDLLHAGHCIMLREAKDQCDHLIVALQVDPSVDRPEKNKPVQSLFERHIQLQSIRDIDEIVVYQTETDLIDILESLPINVRILGEEYKDTNFTGNDVCKRKNIELYFNKRTHRFSTSALRARVEENQKRKENETND